MKIPRLKIPGNLRTQMGLRKSTDQKIPNTIPLTNVLLYCLCLSLSMVWLPIPVIFKIPSAIPFPFCYSLIKETSFNYSLYIYLTLTNALLHSLCLSLSSSSNQFCGPPFSFLLFID